MPRKVFCYRTVLVPCLDVRVASELCLCCVQFLSYDSFAHGACNYYCGQIEYFYTYGPESLPDALLLGQTWWLFSQGEVWSQQLRRPLGPRVSLTLGLEPAATQTL